MTGYDVYFQTGTDEHGQKIQEKAEAAGITPQAAMSTRSRARCKAIWDLMNTILRQVHPHHRPDAREDRCRRSSRSCYDQGDIYKGSV